MTNFLEDLALIRDGAAVVRLTEEWKDLIAAVVEHGGKGSLALVASGVGLRRSDEHASTQRDDPSEAELHDIAVAGMTRADARKALVEMRREMFKPLDGFGDRQRARAAARASAKQERRLARGVK